MRILSKVFWWGLGIMIIVCLSSFFFFFFFYDTLVFVGLHQIIFVI
jgi:hypothetical protein